MSLADAIFRPRTVGLIGASADETKNTARPHRYMRMHGFEGTIVPVNPNRDEVLGEKAWPSLEAYGKPVDHAFIMVPTRFVPAAIEDCAKAGVKVATIYSDGFAEAGEAGQARQQALVDLGRRLGVRIIGPNSMGMIATDIAALLTVNAVLEAGDLVRGRFGLVSQSGTILGTMISRGIPRGIGFSKLVSVGNECDLGVGELAGYLADDPSTDAILLFLETLRDADALAAAARRAFDLGKPVIAYKLGRSSVGEQVALSHTGAIAGTDKAIDAFFRHNGIVRVDNLETLFEAPALFVGRKPPEIRRATVMTTTGGGAATVVDRLGVLGVDLATPGASLKQRMDGYDIRVGESPLIDVTMAGANAEVYGAGLDELVAADNNGIVVAVVGSSGQFKPDIAVRPIVERARSPKPIVSFIAPQADRSLRLLSDAGVAAFRTPESCADAVRAFLDWRAPVVQDHESRNVDLPDLPVAGALTEIEARNLFAALGVPMAAAKLVGPDDDLPDLSYPVAAKVVARDIAHKSDVGGVRLGIRDAAQLREALAGIYRDVGDAMPGVSIDGILVSPMLSGVCEAILGYRLDPQVGPVVVLGAGGVMAEIYRDVAIRMAPVSESEAMEMIAEVRGLAPVLGFRGRKGDAGALVRAVSRFSELSLMMGPILREAEINPLLILEEDGGVAGLDAFASF
ncbi:MAG: acetate--CoA ligase family protein [Rhodospirillales bacterium]